LPEPPILPSLGIDLVDVERIRQKLNDEAFLTRVFTERERTECLRRAKPEESLAARWAAKEAVAKALGVGIGRNLSFQNIEVLDGHGKAPRIELNGPYGAMNMRITLSITHTRTAAAAVVMIYPK
jgi:holo-[acyl-carrier protein] synthase